MAGDFDFPTRVVFGAGRVRELPGIIAPWGRRTLLVTDAGVLRSGAVEPVLDALRAAGLDPLVFDGVDANPTEANVRAGLRAMEESGEGCDVLVAVGGGSVLDAAKAIRLLATHPEPLRHYAEDGSRIGPYLPPLVAIPTTAGTGSEVGRSSVITMGGRKTVIFSPFLIPTVALCDPELTVGMPPSLTAGTGADALTHNVEAFFARGYHPLCDGIALHGMRLVVRTLPIAVANGEDLEARSEMMAAAMMGAVAFQKGLGVVHSLSHPLSTVAGVHHGTANALMLPHAVRFNAAALGGRLDAAAGALGVEPGSDLAATAERVAEMLEEFFARIGLPARLREVAVRPEMLEGMTDLAMQDGCHLLNPRPVSREEMLALYEAAL